MRNVHLICGWPWSIDLVKKDGEFNSFFTRYCADNGWEPDSFEESFKNSAFDYRDGIYVLNGQPIFGCLVGTLAVSGLDEACAMMRRLDYEEALATLKMYRYVLDMNVLPRPNVYLWYVGS